jgi:1-phosphofructokinase family hexose kinase
MKVYTLTPNPALDLSGHVSQLIPNEKNYVFDARRDPGGNGINAARIASRLGARPVALGFLGGPAGEEIRILLNKERVLTQFSAIAGQTRTNVTVTNEQTHQQTRLTFPGPRVSRKELAMLWRELDRLAGPGFFILGGSTPEGCGKDFHARVGSQASRRGLAVVVDVPAKYIEPTIRGFRPYMIKPNQTELEEWYGEKLRNDRELLRAARELAKHVDVVCLSLADRGAMLVSGRGAWFGTSPKIRARGTVGAGDSMVGAMTAYLAREKTRAPRPDQLAQMLRWGVAAGAATAEASGTALARPSEIRRLLRRVKVRHLE